MPRRERQVDRQPRGEPQHQRADRQELRDGRRLAEHAGAEVVAQPAPQRRDRAVDDRHRQLQQLARHDERQQPQRDAALEVQRRQHRAHEQLVADRIQPGADAGQSLRRAAAPASRRARRSPPPRPSPPAPPAACAGVGPSATQNSQPSGKRARLSRFGSVKKGMGAASGIRSLEGNTAGDDAAADRPAPRSSSINETAGLPGGGAGRVRRRRRPG